MLNWALGFFFAAIIAAVFGFGGIASDFASIALVLFWIFVALFAITLIMSLFVRAGEGGSGGLVALLVAALVIGVGIYVWKDHGMNAESVGRSIDQGAHRLSADASDVIDKAGQRTSQVMHNTADHVRRDTSNNRHS
jgi:uncharacterized membrane protein YtjA (UPF0391 family)